ncbi:translation elongation factor Ts [Candidatus Gottesmanbacteria bacterium RBG_16_43_7]|uniref:Elongation factor Ts n=1 Tax=Candidatus Gottesmanbacteria bacterium RBG_16_43_7 TaxID=1798373 RepID=A0A1F5ZBY8_9BACT|nr:MAG: translation elongation factor Ts [Candidatus Gottesmanbacteria bacterium RBG_16_43_7]
MEVTLDLIKKLRAETQCGVSDCRQALVDADGDYKLAKKILKDISVRKAALKAGKSTSQGIISSYVHAGGKIGVLVELKCETDFVARNQQFQSLAHEIALQVAATNPQNVTELLKEISIRDASMTISEQIKQVIARLGENITLSRIHRMSLGE